MTTQRDAYPPPSAGTLTVIGSREHPKWATFRCPCGTGHIARLNLQPSYYPRWRLRLSNDKITLTPSVWFDENPFCHFLIREGRVWWVSRGIGATHRR